MTERSDGSDTQVDLDLGRKATEAEWQRSLDSTILRVVPLWFDWLGWVFIVSVLMILGYTFFLASWIAGLSLGLLWLYFQAVFFRLRIRGIHGVRNRKQEATVALVLSGILAFGAYTLARALAVAAFQAGIGQQ
jgi:hypothetical protein